MSPPHPGRSRDHLRHRVLVVDDHPLMRESIVKILNRAPNLVVCGEADSVTAAMARAAELSPDVVVSDLALVGENGFQLMKQLCAERPGLPVLILSMHRDAFYAAHALQAGAAGYVMKGEGGDVLVAAVQELLAGKVHFSHRVRDHVLQRLMHVAPDGSRPPFATLSPEERLIFEASSRTEPDAITALSFGLDIGQLRHRRETIRRKLRLANDAALRHHAWLWVDAGRPPL